MTRNIGDFALSRDRRGLLERLNPWAFLVTLWILIWLKQMESISLLVFSVPVKLLSTATFVILLVPTLATPRHSRLTDMSPRRRVARCAILGSLPLLAGGMILWTLTFLVQHFGRFGYRLEPGDLWGVGSGFLILGVIAFVVERNPTPRSLAVLLGAAWLVFTLAWMVPLFRFPLHGDRSDMLPNIASAGRIWLNGESPYRTYDVGTHRSPLTYLPLLWLSYLPLAASKLDLRLLTPLSQLGFLVVAWLTWQRSRSTSLASRAHLLWLAVNPFLFLRHDLHTPPLWPLLALTLLLMIERRWIWASLLWGALAAFRVSLWALLPFYVLFLIQQLGWRRGGIQALLLAAVALAIILPFALPNWNGFAQGVIHYRNRYSRLMTIAPWEKAAGWLSGFSLVPPLYFAGLPRLAQPLQVGLLAILLLVIFWRRPGITDTLRLMSVALLLFLLFNPLVEVYMYAPLLILAAFVIWSHPYPSLVSPPAGGDL